MNSTRLIDGLPMYANIIFVLATLYCIIITYIASDKNSTVLVVLVAWTTLNGVLAWSGYFLNVEAIPPRLPVAVVPTIAFITTLFCTTKGKTFIDNLNLKKLTWVHIVRIPVELCLLWLFIAGSIPQIMTFEGVNFDILAGISAPIMIFLYYYSKSISKKVMLAWNIICLLLVLTIVSISVLCAPTPIQQMAFDQPNMGVLYFPFAWLPSVVVPIVVFSHLTAIKQLT